MSLLARLPHGLSCGIRGPAWGAILLLLLPVLGSGAEEEGPIPRLIIGGKRVTVDTYPFVVYIRLPDGRFCTGSIIAPSWVLTAAHCMVEDRAVGPRVYNSVQVNHGLGDRFPSLIKTSKRIILHPNYRRDGGLSRSYDIGLIELSQPFAASFSAGLDLARQTAEEEYAPSGTSSMTLGYGLMENERPTYHMRAFSENLYHAKDCRDWLNIPWAALLVPDDTICSGTSTRRMNSGDSGGPLIVSYSVDGNKRWLQVGVSSRTVGSDSGRIGAYVRVSSYADWIHRTTNGAASLVSAPDPDDDDIDEITRRLSEANAQISSLQTTVQSLQSNRTLLKQRIDEFKGVEGQDRKLQATEDGILGSVSTILAQ